MIDATAWRSQIAGLAAAGADFACLYAADGGKQGLRVTAAFEADEGIRTLSCLASGPVPSIVDLYPAAEWDEREAHDLYGVEFDGHEPLRPLVHHDPEARAWMTPVEGPNVHQVAVGPIHAGIIESGHFRFHLIGERVLALDLRLFYKHRGLERLVEGEDAAGSLRIAGAVCAASSVAIQVAVAQAWEAQGSLVADQELRRARTILIELERLYNHLNDIGAICAGVGYSPGAMAFAALKERAQRLNAELFGHRFLFGTVRVGRSDVTIGEPEARAARAEVESIAADAARFWREILFSVSVQERLRGTGTVSAEVAERLSLVGPVARASGLNRDRRTGPATGLAYGEVFEPARLDVASGDVAARAEIRAVEIEQSCRILGRLLSEPLAVGQTQPASLAAFDAPAAPGSPAAPGASESRFGPWLAAVEGPRGEITCALEVSEGRVTRLHLRTASYRNWPAIREAVIGDILPDFPLINKSFELSYAAVDR